MIPEAEGVVTRWEADLEDRLLLAEDIERACRAYAVRVVERERVNRFSKAEFAAYVLSRLADRIRKGEV